MPAERYYINSDLKQGESATLADQEHRHLVTVMRGRAGNIIELINGRGCCAMAMIMEVGKRESLLQINEVRYEEPPRSEIILAQAIPRINRLDFIVEKGTELGMTQLWLFPGDHSERKSLTEHQLERLQAMAIAAMKQCGRLYLPVICVKEPIKSWQKQPYPLFFGDVGPEAPPLPDGARDAIVCIGPESGLSEAEESHLKAIGGTGVKLHRNILRTDTAAIIAVYALSR